MPCTPCPVSTSRKAILLRIIAADSGTRLERRRDNAIVHEIELDDPRGRSESGLDRGLVSLLETEGDVALRFLPEKRRALLDRRSRIRDRGKLLVLDRDALGRVARFILAARHHEGDRIADMAHAPFGERRARRDDRGGRASRPSRRRKDGRAHPARRSCAVKTPTTPGMADAAEISIERISAWPKGERSTSP